MDETFEKIYEWTNEKIVNEKEKLKEYKNDVRQSEALIIGIIIVCIGLSIFAPSQIAKYTFLTVAILMFLFCTRYTFKHERIIVAKQNKFSELALSELATHIGSSFIYEKDEGMALSYYRKSGFDRVFNKIDSKGLISGTINDRQIAVANIVVKNKSKAVFRGIFGYIRLNNLPIKEIDVMRVDSKNNVKEKYPIPNQELYIYAEDMSEARSILTDEVLEKVKRIREDIKIKFEFMLDANVICFRFYDSITKPIPNDKETKEFLYKYYKIIDFMSELAESIEIKKGGTNFDNIS